MTFSKIWALGLLAISASAVVACESDDGESPATNGDCPENLSYEKTAEPFISKYCVSCHGVNVTGAARMAAPAEHNYGTLALLMESGHETAERVTDEANPMPPKTAAKRPSQADIDVFMQWMECSETIDLGGEHHHE